MNALQLHRSQQGNVALARGVPIGAERSLALVRDMATLTPDPGHAGVGGQARSVCRHDIRMSACFVTHGGAGSPKENQMNATTVPVSTAALPSSRSVLRIRRVTSAHSGADARYQAASVSQ